MFLWFLTNFKVIFGHFWPFFGHSLAKNHENRPDSRDFGQNSGHFLARISRGLKIVIFGNFGQNGHFTIFGLLIGPAAEHLLDSMPIYSYILHTLLYHRCEKYTGAH